MAWGGAEALIAVLLLAVSVHASMTGLIPLASAVLDGAAVVAVLISLRWLRVGVAAAIGVILGVLFFDPNAYGVSLYICMIPVVYAIRRDHLHVALVATAVNAVAGWVVSLRAVDEGDSAIGPMFGWLMLYGIVWAIGLGFRAAAKSEAARMTAEFRKREIEMASELHDSVARDLAVLAMQADAARLSGSATEEELDSIAEQARLANKSIREVTRLLGGGTDARPVPTGASSLEAGVRDLERLGFRVRVSGEQATDIPMSIDVAKGHLLGEALHNVAKHGDPAYPAVVIFSNTPEVLRVTVSNTPREDQRSEAGWGLKGMHHRAEAIGGHVASREVDGTWVCDITLPLPQGRGQVKQ